MLKKLLTHILKHRHFWREATFDELSEIYISMVFRSLALGLIGIFIPVFLIKTGYGLSGVVVFYIMYFAFRTVWDVAAGYVVARLGPKHTILLSYILQIAAAAAFMTLQTLHWPLIVPAFLWASSISHFHVAFHVDFSKVKHPEHGGKEIGYVHMMERIGGAIGPFVGGILATLVGPQMLFMIAIIVLLLGVIPLFRTAEPVRTHQRLEFQTLPVDKIKRDILSYTALLIESNLIIALWPLFLTLFVFIENTYAVIGILSSIGTLVSITGAYFIGKTVDDRKGGLLLKIASVTNAGLYCIRPFATSIVSVLAINISAELTGLGRKLPFTKGFYDRADQLKGHRIVYIVTLEATSSFVKTIVWVHLFILTGVLSSWQVIMVGFGIAAVASLLINTQRFPALEYTRR